MKSVWTVYCKELIDTLRDRKTLMFMFLFPTLVMPGLMFGVTKFIKALAEERALESVKIAATQESQAAYLDIVHKWFVSSEIGKGARVASVGSSIFKALVDPTAAKKPTDFPPEIFNDPAAFQKWAHSWVPYMRKSLDRDEVAKTPELKALPKDQMKLGREFYNVVIKGVGLVEFVDPASIVLKEKPIELGEIPEEIRSRPDIQKIASAIAEKQIHGLLEVPPGYKDVATRENLKVEVTMIHDSTLSLSDEAFGRIQDVIDRSGEGVVKGRLISHKLNENFIKPFEVDDEADTASLSKRILSQVGGMAPYLVMIFCFMGALYPAIDLGAGEKERNTLETLLLAPCSRFDIAFGKYLVILTTSLTSGLLAVLSMGISIQKLLPADLMEQMHLKIEPVTLFLTALLAIPAAATFAGILLAISIYARSFKEAQSYMTPVNILLIIPAMAPMIPGLEMNWKIAMIPLVDISLLAREFIKGDVNWGYYAITMGSSAVLAALCLSYAVWQFKREEVLFRT